MGISVVLQGSRAGDDILGEAKAPLDTLLLRFRGEEEGPELEGT